MRVKKVALGYPVAAFLLGGHAMERLETNLPDDVRVLGADTDPDRQIIWLKIESASFDDLDWGMVIPEFTIEMTRHITELAVIADMVSQKHDEPCPSCGAERPPLTRCCRMPRSESLPRVAGGN